MTSGAQEEIVYVDVKYSVLVYVTGQTVVETALLVTTVMGADV